jgi:hypothetical protein
VQEVFIGAFPGYEGEHALDREGASVYEIAIEEIFVVDSGVAVEFEDVEEVVVLPVDIAAHCNLLLIFNGVIHK